MGQFDSIIFDLDGTLVRTMPAHRYILVRKVLDKFHVHASDETIDKFWYESHRNQIIISYFGIKPKPFWELFRKHDTIELRKEFTKPYYDVGILNELKSKGIRMGVVTGAPNYIAECELNMIERENFGSIILANGSNGIMPKPNPHGIEECLKKMGAKKNRTIVVGNSKEDIEAAKSANVTDFFVDRKEYDFGQINPSFTIKTLYDLKNVFP